MGERAGKPLVIGLTGAIGTGKSNVLQTLVSLGAEGIDADRVAHQVMQPGGPAYAPVLAAFGPDVLRPDGLIDRQRLGAKAFCEPGVLERLERIVHPVVGDRLRVQVAGSKAPAVAVEAIKLFEAGLDRTLCDQVWVTACSRRQQYARLAASRGMPAHKVRSRLAAQMTPREMAARADRVLDTGGAVAATRLMVLDAWVELGLPVPEPRIRPAETGDAEGIAAVLHAVAQQDSPSPVAGTFTPAQERSFLRKLPRRARVTIAEVGNVLAGFQVIGPYAAHGGAMDHVAMMETYLAAPVREAGLGRRLSETTLNYAPAAGWRKIVIQIPAGDPVAHAFHTALGFQVCGRLTRQAQVADRYVDVLLLEKFVE